MFYPRKLYLPLKEHLSKSPITVLTGMRRTGKTFLVKHILQEFPTKNKLYIDLERPDNRELFSLKNYDLLLSAFESRGLNIKKPMLIVLDEIQMVPQIPSILKYLFDHYSIKFIVTGSSSYYLKNLFTESLSGRKKIFELFPLDFGEYLTFKEIPFKKKPWANLPFDEHEYERISVHYEDFIHFGGFPQVVLSQSKEDKKDMLFDILSSYINFDVKSLADFEDERNFYRLTKMLSGRAGTRLDYSKISRLSGLSRPTVHNYIDFLEKTYLIKRLSVYSNNPDREIVKAQKIYFCDTGIMNILAENSSGVQFENSVFNQIKQQGKIQYFSKKTGQEIDFVFEENTGMEVKETPTDSDLKDLQRNAASAKIKSTHLIGRYPSPKFKNYIWGGSIL